MDGKLAGQRGRVTQVNYSFKIRLSDYKRVISVADIAVDGLFYAAGSHLVTFDRGVLPACQAARMVPAACGPGGGVCQRRGRRSILPG